MAQFRPQGFQVLPTIVKNLLIINALVLFLQFVLLKLGIDLTDYLGLHYWKSPLFKPWQLITHLFLHSTDNIMHLVSNMFALWMFGSTLENMWGPKRFLIFYLICGLGAAICHLGVLGYEYHAFEQAFMQYQQNPTIDQYSIFIRKHSDIAARPWFQNLLSEWSNDPSNYAYSQDSIRGLYTYYTGWINTTTVGASGAVFGLLFAFGYMFPNLPLYILAVVPIKAKWAVTAYGLFELYNGFLTNDNIAHFAHLGGMLFAFILLKIWRYKSNNYYY